MFGRRTHNRELCPSSEMRVTWGAFIAIIAATISFAVPASAEIDDSSDTVETVYVTARKQSEDLQKVPLPVTALSGKDLSDRNDTQVKQLQLIVPGLTVADSNARQMNFALRGLGNNPTSNGLAS